MPKERTSIKFYGNAVCPIVCAKIDDNHIRHNIADMQVSGSLIRAAGRKQRITARQLCYSAAGPGIIHKQFTAEEINNFPPPSVFHFPNTGSETVFAEIKQVISKRIIPVQRTDRISQNRKLLAEIRIMRFPFQIRIKFLPAFQNSAGRHGDCTKCLFQRIRIRKPPFISFGRKAVKFLFKSRNIGARHIRIISDRTFD